MIKTTRYCDICGKEIWNKFYYQLILPETDYNGEMILSEDKKDLCKECLNKIYQEINVLKHPNRKCPD